MSEGMQLATVCHTKMDGEHAALRVWVSFAVKSVLGRSLRDIFRVEVMGELAAKFQKMEDRCSWLQWPITRVCDLLLGPPPDRARLVDHLDEAVKQLRVELAAWQEADAELEALRTSAE
jgi:hypothetical protein